jgi:hypothetical protein
MRAWAWSIYINGSKEQSKIRKSIDHNEPQIIANLNKRIDRIERQKLKFNDDLNRENVKLFDERSITNMVELSTRVQAQLKHARLSVPAISASIKSFCRKSLVENTLKMETISEIEQQRSTLPDQSTDKNFNKLKETFRFDMNQFSDKVSLLMQKKNPKSTRSSHKPSVTLPKTLSDTNLYELKETKTKFSIQHLPY